MKKLEDLKVGTEYGLKGGKVRATYLGLFNFPSQMEVYEVLVFEPTGDVDPNVFLTGAGVRYGFPDAKKVIPLWNGPDLIETILD